MNDLMYEKRTLPEQDREPNNEEEAGESLVREPEEAPLAIVGIGASAGGLEALEQFFTHMPADSGMAFVVISHQDPNQTSLLPEILQKYTEMPVVQVAEGGVDARQNTVYIKTLRLRPCRPPGYLDPPQTHKVGG